MSKTDDGVTTRTIRLVGDLVWTSSGNVVTVAGEVDVASTREFAQVLRASDDDPLIYALDLSRVRFFSAAGVRCFVEAGWSRRPHPIVIASPAVRRVLDLCGLGHLLDRHGWRTEPDLALESAS